MKRLNQTHYIEPRSKDAHISLDGVWDYAFLDAGCDNPEAIDWKHKTNIPSSTYRSLVDSGILPDPYKGTNCYLFNWVDEKVWYYRRRFNVAPQGRKAFLVFDGVSYYSRIWLNGTLIGAHDGMFGGPVAQVSELLNNGENELIVEVKAGNWGHKENWKTFNNDGSQTVIIPWNLIRDKSTSNGQFIAFGIWRGVRLELLNPCHLSRPYLTTEEITGSTARLHLSCEIVPAALDELECCDPEEIDRRGYLFAAGKGLNIEPTGENAEVRILIDDGELKYDETIPFKLYNSCGYDKSFPEPNYFEHDITISDPKLWYPVGLGKPNLCRVTIELYSDKKLIDRQEFDFGIRVVKRDFTAGQKFLSRFERFRFSINGRDFFLRGMNWMPIDFLLDCTDSDYQWVLEAVRDAGIQLIRVWSGGGIPESDVFYSLCDKYGIMVWQDHFIANMKTPNWDRLVLETQESYNLYRIRNHPSLVIHCGGNEFNAYAYDNAASMNIIERCIKDIDPKREYFRTTPDGGSAHVYRDMEPVWYRKAYRDLPFLAESGLHSFPGAGTLRTLVSPNETNGRLNDIFTDNFKVTHPEIICHFTEFQADRVPQMLARASQITDIRSMTLDDICEATQMASYEFYQIMIESMRENYPVCGGIMPWVFKRPWTTVAVQLMDGSGEALAPYYAVSNAYSDIAVSLCLNELVYAPGETVDFCAALVNSSDSDTRGRIRLRIFSPELDTIFDESRELRVEKHSIVRLDIGSFSFGEELRDTQVSVFLTYEADKTVISRKFYALRCLSELENIETRKNWRGGVNPNLRFDNGPWLREEWRAAPRAKLELHEIECRRDADFVTGSVLVKNLSDNPAYPVKLSASDDEVKTCFSDSFFLLDAHEERMIDFRLKGCQDSLKLSASAWNADKVMTALRYIN